MVEVKNDAHTPGPWEVVNGTDVYPVGDTDGRFYVAHCDPDDAPLSLTQYRPGEHERTDSTYERQMANARLIAAAPDLLEAAKDTLASLVAAVSLLKRGSKSAAASDRMFDQMILDYEASIARARAAILKASPNLPSASQEDGE